MKGTGIKDLYKGFTSEAVMEQISQVIQNNRKEVSLLTRGELFFFAILFLFFLFFADLVQVRSAFLSRVMGDADVFFRAGWAVRAGKNIYEVSDPNNWHYNYPPMFAVLISPLGDPPPGESRAGYLPYPVSISILYKISLLFFLGGALFLVVSVKRIFPDLFPNYTERRVFYLLVTAIVATIVPVAHTLMRGQVNLFLVGLVCFAVGCQIRNQNFLSGVFIALSISLKIFPAFLLIVPVWRKSFAQMGGVVFGLILGLIVIPEIGLGHQRTILAYSDLYKVLIGPALGLSKDSSRDVELNDFNSTDNHSILAFLHGIENPNLAKKPPKPGSMNKVIHLSMSALLLGWLLWIKGKPATGTPLADGCFFSIATLIMLFASPVTHSHYFCLILPLVVFLHLKSWTYDVKNFIPLGFGTLLLFYLVGTTLPLLPQFETFKRMGVIFIPNFVLFIYAMVVFGKIQKNQSVIPAS